MTRAAKPAAPVLLTDWFPCTRPPWIEGEYDAKYTNGYLGIKPVVFRVKRDNGKWFSTESGYKLPGLNHDPQNFKWRGQRRWVLTSKDQLLLGVERECSYLVKISKRGVQHWSDRLDMAIAFDSQSDAEMYCKRKTVGKLADDITAVLP